MKPLLRSMFVASLVMCAITANQALAQSFPFSAKLVVQQQGPSSLKNGVYSDKIENLKFGTMELLSLLEEAYPAEFPNGFPFGSQLVLVNYDHFEVRSPSGSVLVDNTSPFLKYDDTFSKTNYIYQGKENTVTGALNEVFFYRSTITFNNPAAETSFTFSGNTIEKYTRSAEDPAGNRHSKGSLSINGTGSGMVGGYYFLMSGRISTPKVSWIE